MYELPPILQGSESRQLAELRDYLVRMARSLEPVLSAAPTASAASAVTAPGTAVPASAAEESAVGELRKNAANLRALIVKSARSAEILAQDLGVLRADMESGYLARSELGEVMEQVETNIIATARGVVDSYDFQSLIRAVNDRADALDEHVSSLRGEIRRGLITDPDTGEQCLGIAISEELRFTGAVHEEGGLRYYELAPGQTLGLYTATGWQFWVNGARRGWFDSADGRLHVMGEAVESELQLGAWTLSAVNGLGIKYLGEQEN